MSRKCVSAASIEYPARSRAQRISSRVDRHAVGGHGDSASVVGEVSRARPMGAEGSGIPWGRPGLLPDQERPALPQIPPPPLVVRHDAPHRPPVVAAVPVVPWMHQFMDDDVVHGEHRRLDDPPLGPNHPGVVAVVRVLLLDRHYDHSGTRPAIVSQSSEAGQIASEEWFSWIVEDRSANYLCSSSK